MAKILIFVTAFCGILFQSVSPMTVQSGSFVINRADNTYLYSRRDGVTCGALSTVITTPFIDISPVSHWTLFSGGMLVNMGEERNEVSLQAGGCFSVAHEYETPSTGNGFFLLKSKSRGQCVTNSGAGNRVGWSTCNSQAANQQWKLQVVP
ncbi:uncharacterized protein LOC118438334 [Folsomia candida]|uniref:uncharacterized protein LOC118438334 n=1 Tax=Folsomia candida TaxID=158441 RepID=UPI001604FDCC|nr:uncharacterized protein LOC118438334 [Folsomia candida]